VYGILMAADVYLLVKYAMAGAEAAAQPGLTQKTYRNSQQQGDWD
jgi:hypothetical protein